MEIHSGTGPKSVKIASTEDFLSTRGYILLHANLSLTLLRLRPQLNVIRLILESIQRRINT